MSVTPLSRSDVVTRLRAAGCVFAEDEAELLMSAAETAAELDAMVRRRSTGIPLEHLLGWAEFCGLRISLTPGVFVPRRRTEFLARQAIALARPGAMVADLCCGSGAVGAAVAAALDVRLFAADIDPVAVQCARRNLDAEVLKVEVFEGDLFDPLPGSVRGRLDVVVANVPYVPTEAIATMPPEARVHENRAALDGGDDGLAVLRRVAAEAPDWLAPGGHLLIETSESQAPHAAKVFSRHGLTPRTTGSEELGATVVIGTR
jgi:release factor glutamine methyltransferase